MAEVKPEVETFAKIKVAGVGGSGCNAVTRMIQCKLTGVDFVAINTDAQDLHACLAGEKIHIGKNLTRGLGAGMNPEVGRQAAEENRDEIQEVFKGCDMVFVVYGAGGGTGSGAGPVIAEAAREAGALTVGVATKPFTFEGKQRMVIAEESLENLKDRVDTSITIQNDRLLQIVDRQTSLLNAFKIVDDVLRQGVQGISDLITKPGIINVDFADIKSVIQDSGSALMGVGVSSGEDRAQKAAKQAINSPLLDISIEGAKGVLFNITGGLDLTMMEINEAAGLITENIDPNARIIFGATSDETIKKDEIKITVVATGFDNNKAPQDNLFGDSREKDDDSEEAKDDFRKSEISSFVEEDNLDDSADNVNGFNADNDFKNKDLNYSYDENKKRQALEDEENPLNDPDDDIDIPAFIRKKMGK